VARAGCAAPQGPTGVVDCGMTLGSRIRRGTVVLLAALLLAAPAAAREGALAQMRDLLARGYYNSAAQLNGPNLVQNFPDDPDAHLLYATALFLVGDLAAASERLAMATDRAGGGVPPSHVHLGGLIKAAQGDPLGAVRPLQNAFLRSRSYEFAMDWARVAWQAGLFEEALVALSEAATTERGRRQPWPHLSRGRLLAALGRTSEAIIAFETAIDVFEANDPGGLLPSPAYVEAWYRLGEAYESLGETTRAEVSYKAARGADPNYGPAILALERLARRVDRAP
jgi:tetratricopeptide (TPR) repeat protein